MDASDFPWTVGASMVDLANGRTVLHFPPTGTITADVTLAPAGTLQLAWAGGRLRGAVLRRTPGSGEAAGRPSPRVLSTGGTRRRAFGSSRPRGFDGGNAMRTLRTLVVGLALLLPGLAAAQDAEGCKDHPLFTRMKGYVLTGCEAKFDQALIMLDEDPDSARNLRPEGDLTLLSYDFEEGGKAPSYLQVRRNYQNAAKALKARILVDRERYTALQLDRSGAKVFVGIELFNDGRTLRLVVLEQKAMVQEITADEMWKALQRDGFMALQILFDTGKATIKPESQAIVAQIVELLNAQPTLSISIEGHTDAQGTAAANKVLSSDRAAAVMKAVVAGGIPARRLRAQGWGQERPVADNRTEDGRAKNRRVEIVKL